MEDFIELAFEGMDYGVDKGFHKVPDKVLQNPFHRKSRKNGEPLSKSSSRNDVDDRPIQREPSPQSSTDEHDYDRPKRSSKSSRSRRDSSPQYDDTGYYSDPYAHDDRSNTRDRRSRGLGENRDEGRDRPRDLHGDRPRSRATDAGGGYSNTSHYTPQAGLVAYQAPPASYNGPYDPRIRYPTPNAANGYLGPSDPYDPYPDEVSSIRRSRSTGQSRKRPELKQRSSSIEGGGRLKNVFSDSDRGLGIGALGAIAGGLLAQEAGRKKGGKQKGIKDPVVLTLLGAAIGGLGANALEKGLDKRGERLKRERREDGDRR